jgi:hypothetical protein
MNARRWITRHAMLVAALVATPARLQAQEFAPADAVPLAGSALAFLEHGMAPARPGLSLEAQSLERTSLPELGTRALALGLAWRGLRVAAGVAATGDPEIGWNTAAIAMGAGSARGGGALRGVARRDRHPQPRETPVGAGVGLEAGAGAWAEALPGVRVWASAPSPWTRGEPPPLARALEIGAVAERRGVRAWLARAAGAGEHRAGVALVAGVVGVWLEARDGPLRGAAGVRASAGAVGLRAGVDSHPVLGETVRVAIGVGGGW